MNRLNLLFCLFVGIAGVSTNGLAEDDYAVRYELQVFRLNGSFEKKTDLSKSIWKGSRKEWDAIKDEITLFDDGEFRIGGGRLFINRQGCHWNEERLTFEEGHKADLPEDRIKMVYSPNILKREKETVHMKIESRQPFEYMEKREGETFELQQIALPVGLDIKVRADRERKDVFLLDLSLDLRSVDRREDAKGTGLNVGKPVLEEHDYKLKIEVREGKNYGILLRPKGSQGAIIIRLDIDDE